MRLVGPTLQYARANRSRFVQELREFVRFASVSVQARHAEDVRAAAVWLVQHLRKIGLERTCIFTTARHPIVYGEWRGAAGSPTVLVYGHYDVQPVDPVKSWLSAPFEAEVRGNHLYGRGASDDKGQMFIHLKAIESFLGSTGHLPVNVKCLFEGEEEIGSPNLAGFIHDNRKALKCDVAVISDTRMLSVNRPALTYSLRGQLALEIEIRGPQHDLHSGNFGGAVPNPLQILCEVLAALHDHRGRVAIPGFYDRVRLLSAAERDFLRRTGPTDEKILDDAAVTRSRGEIGYSAYERVSVRPALTVNGISGGYAGSGGKGVIPARALAKLSFRLVPDQDPREAEALFREHVLRLTPPSVESVVRVNGAAWPAVTDRRHPALRAASRACQKIFGARPVFLRSGGSIPAVSTMQRFLGIPVVLLGFSLPTDHIHAPNERFHLPTFFRGIETAIWFLAEINAGLRYQQPPDAATTLSSLVP